MTIKLFYNKEPNKNLVSAKDGADVWHDIILPDGTQSNYTGIGDIFNALGIDFKWSSDMKSSIPFINVGSLSHRSSKFYKICEYANINFDKAIILSTQEPWQKDILDKFILEFKNLFFMDCSTHLYDGEQYHKRYMPFPFLLCKFASLKSQITVVYPSICYTNQIKAFNCLMNNWRPDKHVLFTALKNKISNFTHDAGDLVEENMVTYRKIKSSKESVIFKYLNKVDEDRNFLRSLEIGLETYEDLELENEVYLKDTLGFIKERHFDCTFRIIPEHVFNDTYFSLVCESFSGSSFIKKFNEIKQSNEINYIDSRPYITEKTILPLINGHPWISYAEIGFHNTMKELGFEIHDEIFDMSFDQVQCNIVRADVLTTMINNLNYNELKNQIKNHTSETRQKILHNQNLCLNKNSRLWKELEYIMLKYLRTFNDF